MLQLIKYHNYIVISRIMGYSKIIKGNNEAYSKKTFLHDCFSLLLLNTVQYCLCG